MSNPTRRARPGNPLVAVAYLRVSTEDQRLGPEAQRAAIEAWAMREGAVVVAWHVDSGVCGGSDLADRPGLLEALTNLKAARAGVLVVAKRDRLARDVMVSAMIERAVDAAGGVVRSAAGEGNGSTPADAFMRTVIDGAAAYERALIRARTKAALSAKRARGERAGEVPYGYTADDVGRLVPSPAEQKVLDAVRQLRAGGRSLRAIVRDLASRRLMSRAGSPFGLTQVARMARMAA
jgi:DNA invertase Pin-like site-specific DNA recombinase